jgi:hypothetical protein
VRILVACEESGTVTQAFRRRWGDAHQIYSCDLLPTSGRLPQRHIQADVLELLKMDWDMVLAFPPCTHLAVSGALHFDEKKRDGRQQRAIGFFLAFTALDHVPHVCIENPVGIMSKLYRKPDQFIQPYQFGHPETKKTCLWLKGLPPLEPTKDLEAEVMAMDRRDRQAIMKLSPSAERGRIRSKTYDGIARAMADQWGDEERLVPAQMEIDVTDMGGASRPSY